MDVKLLFRNTPQGDAVAYLLKEDAPDDGGQVVRSEGEYQLLVREVMSASNRTREIMITDTVASARSIALLRRAESSAETIVSKVDENIFSIGIISYAGDYDDGLPMIMDLREVGRPLTLTGDFEPQNDIHVAIMNETPDPIRHAGNPRQYYAEAIMLFGVDLVSAFNNEKPLDGVDGEVKIVNFRTQREYNAYFQGLSDVGVDGSYCLALDDLEQSGFFASLDESPGIDEDMEQAFIDWHDDQLQVSENEIGSGPS